MITKITWLDPVRPVISRFRDRDINKKAVTGGAEMFWPVQFKKKTLVYFRLAYREV